MISDNVLQVSSIRKNDIRIFPIQLPVSGIAVANQLEDPLNRSHVSLSFFDG